MRSRCRSIAPGFPRRIDGLPGADSRQQSADRFLEFSWPWFPKGVGPSPLLNATIGRLFRGQITQAAVDSRAPPVWCCAQSLSSHAVQLVDSDENAGLHPGRSLHECTADALWVADAHRAELWAVAERIVNQALAEIRIEIQVAG
jgi:hypothetical protein